MSVYIYMWECAHECNCLQVQKLEASDSLKLPDMGSGNRTGSSTFLNTKPSLQNWMCFWLTCCSEHLWFKECSLLPSSLLTTQKKKNINKSLGSEISKPEKFCPGHKYITIKSLPSLADACVGASSHAPTMPLPAFSLNLTLTHRSPYPSHLGAPHSDTGNGSVFLS